MYVSEENIMQGTNEMDASSEKGQKMITAGNCDIFLSDPNLAKASNATNKIFLCDECGKKFTTKMSLNFHLKGHKFSGHKSLLKCDICEELFPGKASLARHRRNHQKEFRCGECGKCFGKKANLEGHKLIHEGRQPYKCDSCGEEFAYKSLLLYHIKDHTGEKSFECNICGQKLKSKSNLKSHMQIHSSERNFKCAICSKTFRYSRHLVTHIKTHTKLMPVSCEVCNASFASKKTLKVHMARHFGKLNFKCKLCLQGFDTRTKFLKHKDSHIAENQWKCLLCREIFLNKTSLITHKRSHDDYYDDKILKNKGLRICKLCDKKFPRKRNFKIHSQMHIAKNSWKCLICEKIFMTKLLLFSHRRKSHKTYVRSCTYTCICEFCDKSFSRTGSLNIHKRFHIGKDKWKCLKCSQIFSSLDLLHVHKKTSHAIEVKKLFKCDFCDKAFTTKGNVKQHNTVHIGNNAWKCWTCSSVLSDYDSLMCHRRSCLEKNLKCNFCDKGFSSKDALRQHNKVHIEMNSWKCLVCSCILSDYDSLMSHRQSCFDKSLKCNYCDKGFSTKDSLKQHNKVHIAKNSWKCLACSCVLSDYDSLMYHRRSCPEKSLKCSFCDKSFSTKDTLKQHNNVHIEKNSWKCLVCSCILSDYDSFISHIPSCLENSLKCNFCDKGFSTKVALKKHNKVHIARDSWKCLACSCVLSDFDSLKSHRRSCLGKSLKCNFCDGVFTNSQSLMYHKKIHTAENHWKCLNCDKVFPDRTFFIIHLQNCKKGSSVPVKQNWCQFCEKSFKNSYSLNAHKQIHVGINRWKCSTCHEIFSNKKSVKYHKRKTHSKCKVASDKQTCPTSSRKTSQMHKQDVKKVKVIHKNRGDKTDERTEIDTVKSNSDPSKGVNCCRNLKGGSMIESVKPNQEHYNKTEDALTLFTEENVSLSKKEKDSFSNENISSISTGINASYQDKAAKKTDNLQNTFPTHVPFQKSVQPLVSETVKPALCSLKERHSHGNSVYKTTFKSREPNQMHVNEPGDGHKFHTNTGEAKEIEKVSLSKRNENMSLKQRLPTASFVRNCSEVDEIARKTDIFQSTITNVANTGLAENLQAQISHSDLRIENKHIPFEFDIHSTFAGTYNTRINNYSDQQVTFSDSCLENNQDELLKSTFAAIKSETDVKLYSNIDSSHSSVSNQTSCQMSGFAEPKSEHIAPYDLEDIKPDMPCVTEKIANSIYVRQEVLNPVINMTDGSKYTQQNGNYDMVKTLCNVLKKSSNKLLYMCDICHGIFPDQLSEWVHKRIHDRNTFPFKCKFCSMKFCIMDDFVRHQSKHKNGKPQAFYCCFCDESFSDGDICKYHIKFRLCLVS